MRRPEQSHLKFDAASHAGMLGKQNEDRYAVTPFSIGTKKRIPSVLAVLCDGIGGHRAGEVAAELGVSVITETILAGDPSQPLKTIGEGINRANAAIYQASQTDRGRQGMGTTCALAWVIGDRLYTANLGDSRIYLLRGGHFVQLSTDHTWVQEALDAGILMDTEGENHPNAHVIRRYLGSKKAPEPDFRLWFFEGEGGSDALANQGFKLEPGDRILLCSDGLTDLVSDEEISTVLQSTPQPEAPNALIAMANQRGGHDNTTVILMSVPARRKSSVGTKRKRRLAVGCLVVLVVMSFLVTAFVWGLRLRRATLDLTRTPSPGITQTVLEELLEIPSATIDSLRPTKALTDETPTETISPAPTRTPWPTNTPSGE